MTPRFATHVWVVSLGLLSGLGCATTSLTTAIVPLTAKLGAPAPEKATPADLPPAQAAELCVRLGHDLEREGHDAEAVRQYELARHYRPDADVASRLAVLYDRQGNPTRAMPEYERALKAHPHDADLLNDLGYHQYSLGHWADAERVLRQALDANPKHAHAWTNLGMTLAQEGRYKESLVAFRHSVRPAEAQCNLAFLLATQGKREEARAAYQEALRLEPDLQLARAGLAKLDEPAAATPAAASGPPAGHAVTTTAAKPPEPAAEGIRTVAAGPADGVTPEPAPAPAPLPAGKGTSGWVIPGPGDQAGAKPAVAGSAAGAVPGLPSPAATAALEPGPTPAAGPDNAPLHWVAPPPVPAPALPPDLVPAKRAAPVTPH